tara:strand:- start:1142 stop:1354 length:213 start_codon:yes stop_codon:yes gene_type:complete
MELIEGDLVYIPQDVLLYNLQSGSKRFRTDKPTTAIFLREEPNSTVKVFVDGSEMIVRKNHIYIMEKRCS